MLLRVIVPHNFSSSGRVASGAIAAAGLRRSTWRYAAKTLHFISPSYTHEKLEPPFFRDIVDIFEDRMMNWLVKPAKALLAVRHGEVAAVALTTNYFEGIEIYASGKDSKGHSKKCFVRGFKRVFPGFSGPEYLETAVHSSFYELLRCGFAHDAIFRHGMYWLVSRIKLVGWADERKPNNSHGGNTPSATGAPIPRTARIFLP